MYQALQKASTITGKKVILIECGWHANEAIAKAYIQASELACPNIKVVHLDGREVSNRKLAWASADIFCSLSDNIQETFGISPVEAMAAGLPCVVSDWDGYKDTVRDGVDGILIPTTMPGPTGSRLPRRSGRTACGWTPPRGSGPTARATRILWWCASVGATRPTTRWSTHARRVKALGTASTARPSATTRRVRRRRLCTAA